MIMVKNLRANEYSGDEDRDAVNTMTVTLKEKVNSQEDDGRR